MKQLTNEFAVNIWVKTDLEFLVETKYMDVTGFYKKGGKRMETLDELYIIIFSEGLPFLIPVFWIDNIKGNHGQREDLPMIDLAQLIAAQRQMSKALYYYSFP